MKTLSTRVGGWYSCLCIVVVLFLRNSHLQQDLLRDVEVTVSKCLSSYLPCLCKQCNEIIVVYFISFKVESRVLLNILFFFLFLYVFDHFIKIFAFICGVKPRDEWCMERKDDYVRKIIVWKYLNDSEYQLLPWGAQHEHCFETWFIDRVNSGLGGWKPVLPLIRKKSNYW